MKYKSGFLVFLVKNNNELLPNYIKNLIIFRTESLEAICSENS